MPHQRIESFHFVTAVWGPSHRRTFIEIGLPSLLAAGNIPGISALGRSRFHLFTKPSDLRILEASPVFGLLRRTIEVEIDLIDEQFDIAPHLMMSQCHREGLRRAYELGAGTVFVPPDCVWADNSMVNLERIAAGKATTVHMTGLRLSLEEAAPRLISEWRAPDECLLRIPPRDLVRLGLQHLHPITKDLFFTGQSEKLMPANLLWMVENEGILAHCFHLHPLLVEPNERNTTFKTTIDDDLALMADPAGTRDYVVQDSDEILAFELSARSHAVQATYDKGSVESVAAWAEAGANSRHRTLVGNPIRIHSTDVAAERWAPVEQQAGSVVQQTLALLERSTFYLFRKGLHKNILHRSYAATRNTPEAKLYLDLHASYQKFPVTYLKLRRAQMRLLQFFVTLPQWIIYNSFRVWRGIHRVFFEPPVTIRPWHWRWPYEKEVNRPLLAAVSQAGNRGLILQGYGSYLDAVNRSSQTTVVALSSLAAGIPTYIGDRVFDSIVCLGARNEIAATDIAPIAVLLSNSGQLQLCIPAPDKPTITKIIESMPPGLKVCGQSFRGSLGTALLTKLFSLYRSSPFIRWVRGHPSPLMLAVRLVASLPLIPLYVLASTLASAINLLGKSDRVPAVAVITIRKVPA
jgi:hypothetical protein